MQSNFLIHHKSVGPQCSAVVESYESGPDNIFLQGVEFSGNNNNNNNNILLLSKALFQTY